MQRTLAGILAVWLGLPTSSSAGLSALPGGSTHSFMAPFTLLQTPAAAGQPDAGVRREVAQLGVGKKIRLRTVAGEELRGRITSIDDGTFGLDTGQQRVISYADVSALERQGMNGWLMAGIIGGAVFAGVALIAGGLER